MPWLPKGTLFVAAALAWAGCAVSAASSFHTSDPDSWGHQVAEAAVWALDTQPSLKRRDCSGLVTVILARAGVQVQGGSASFWNAAEHDGRIVAQPQPGDLALFDRTYDANRNTLVDDLLTHVALVIDIESDGTVLMVHYGSGHIKLLKMNLAYPSVHKRDGHLLNDVLRSPGYGPKDGARLAGQLFRGFARPPQPNAPPQEST